MDRKVFELVREPFQHLLDRRTPLSAEEEFSANQAIGILASFFLGNDDAFSSDGAGSRFAGILFNSEFREKTVMRLANYKFIEAWKEKFSNAVKASPNSNLGADLLAAYVVEMQPTFENVQERAVTYLYGQLSPRMASYSTWKTLEGDWGDTSDKHKTRMSELDKITVDQMALATERFAQVNSWIEKLATDNLAQAETIADSQSRLAALDASILVNETNLAAFKTAAAEAQKIDTARTLWKSRVKSHALWFWVSLAALGAMTVGPIIYTFWHVDSILEAIKRFTSPTSFITDQVTSDKASLNESITLAIVVSRLILFTVPFILYFWLIKIIVRFNSRSLMLLDDASLRSTSMDTYFHLIEKGAAVTEDRALLLNALFRAAPGQPVDTVEPPNFTDLIQKMSAAKPV